MCKEERLKIGEVKRRKDGEWKEQGEGCEGLEREECNNKGKEEEGGGGQTITVGGRGERRKRGGAISFPSTIRPQQYLIL